MRKNMPSGRAYCMLQVVSLLILAGSAEVCGQSAFQQLQNMAGTSVNIPKVSAPVPVGGASALSSAARSVAPSLSSSPSSIITAGIMQALISNLFSAPDPKAQQAAIDAQKAEEARQAMEAEQQRQLREAIEREKYDNMMKMYKTGPGSGDLEIKDETSLDFKTLDGDAEALSRGARDQFESGSLSDAIPEIEGGTDFFGVDVSSSQFKTLTDPDNDPNVVDLRKAEGIIENGIAKEEAARAKEMKQEDAAKTDKTKTPEFCSEMQKKLDGFTQTRARFQKTIDMTQSELSKWHQQNNGALWNSAKSGVSLVSDVFMKHIDLRKTGAVDIKKYLTELSPVGSPAAVDNYISLLDKVISYKKTLSVVDNGKKVLDWATLVRDESQVIANEIARDDKSVLAMLNDPTVKKVLNDGRPFMDAEQSFVSKSIEIFLQGPAIQKKLVSAFSQTMPIVAWCQFAVDQTYNATDWVLSYNRICDFNNVSGKEAEAAQYLQDKINEIRVSMDGCPPSGF